MRQLAERAYFVACLALGALLRSARYSKTLIVGQGSARQVRKRRVFFAPLLIWMARPVFRMLDTGVRVLSQRDWEERERSFYRSLYGRSIYVAPDGTLVLPLLAGQTLADLLESPDASDRKRAIELAVAALVELHTQGFTHGDGMADNVMIDLEEGAARWFDFENVHDASRPLVWRRADDVRALLTTCVLGADPDECAACVEVILDGYADEALTLFLSETFASAWRRPLAFHLGQAGLSFQSWREIARVLRAYEVVRHPNVA